MEEAPRPRRQRPEPPRGLPPPGEKGGNSRSVERAPPPLVPVRCYSCGLQIAARHFKFNELIRKGESAVLALSAVGAVRVCCRRMILSQPVFPDRLAVSSVLEEDCGQPKLGV